MNTLIYSSAVVVAYLFGSVPFGLVFSRVMGDVDVRTIGSGNIGATNVLRAAGKTAALLTLLADCAKGFTPALMAGAMSDNSYLPAVCGMSAVIGHNFPVFLRFKGGKGVATSLGVILALSPWIALICLVVWLVTAVLLKYSSLAALVAFAAYPIVVFAFRDERSLQLLSLALFALVYYRHRENIKRLIAGSEPKIGQK